MSKKGMQSNAASSGEETALGKMSVKEKGKAIGGNPDARDRKNIQDLIDSYEKAYPGRLARMKHDAVVEFKLSGRNKYGETSKDSEMRLTMWMPADLMSVLEQGYPSIWFNKKHQEWFLKNFEIFKAMEVL